MSSPLPPQPPTQNCFPTPAQSLTRTSAPEPTSPLAWTPESFDGHRRDGLPPDHPPSRALALLTGALIIICVPSLFARDTRNVEYYATQIGEQRALRQKDGSVITLNTDSSIDLRYDGPTVYVQISRGEAHFNMAPTGQRRLVVSVAGIEVIDTATIFDVRTTEHGARVTVKEGQVTLAMAHLPDVALHQNQQATIDARSDHLNIRVHDIPSREVDRQLSWLQGYLDFQCERLGSAAREFNRYSRTHIDVMDEATRNVQIGGVFSTTDPVTFAEAMAKVMPNTHLDSTEAPDGTRILRLSQTPHKRPIPASSCTAALNSDE